MSAAPQASQFGSCAESIAGPARSRAEPIRTDYLSSEDLGCLTIADKNVYFVGTHRALKIPFKKLASAQLYSDGNEIFQNGVTAKPLIFKVDDPPFAANLLAAAVN